MTGQGLKDPGRRFDRIIRLYGPEGADRLARSHVMIVGCGGVGSWAAEMTARSAVGRITLIDFDFVCIRNFNRQLQAVDGNVGKIKVDVLAERLKLITPLARIDAVAGALTEQSCADIMKERPDFLIDAIDHVSSKCFLINHCRSNGIPMIVSTGSGGRTDPTQVRGMDLGLTELDPLARAVRGILRDKYGFPKKGKFKVQAVCSLEVPRKPDSTMQETDCKAGCMCPHGESGFHSCTKRSLVLGTAGFVTGAFGMACAAEAVRHICSAPRPA